MGEAHGRSCQARAERARDAGSQQVRKETIMLSAMILHIVAPILCGVTMGSAALVQGVPAQEAGRFGAEMAHETASLLRMVR